MDLKSWAKGLGVRRLCLLAAGVQAAVAGAFTAVFFRQMAGPTSNMGLYLEYASRIVGGAIPYRDFPVEYPILTMPVIVLPRLVSANLVAYLVAFSVEMAIFNFLAISLVARRVEASEGIGGVPGRLAWHTVFSVLMCPLLFTRYDVAPAYLGFAGACLWASGRPAWGGVFGGLGALMKISPGVGVLPAVVREVTQPRATRLRGTLALAAVVGAGVAAWVLIGGPGFFTSLQYHTGRGLEVGSLPGGLLMLQDRAAGRASEIEFNFGAYHLAGAQAARVARFMLPIQAASILAVLAIGRWSRRADDLRFGAAALLAFAIMGKVLSPQYLIWLIPFFAAIDGPVGRWGRPLFALGCLLTTLIYPVLFKSLLASSGGAILLLNARNAVLLALLGLLAFGPAAPPEPPPRQPAG